MNTPEISQDDLYDLGFEPVENENEKTMEYKHNDLDIHLWKALASTHPEASYWKSGYGRDKVVFKTLEQLKEFIAEKQD